MGAPVSKRDSGGRPSFGNRFVRRVSFKPPHRLRRRHCSELHQRVGFSDGRAVGRLRPGPLQNALQTQPLQTRRCRFVARCMRLATAGQPRSKQRTRRTGSHTRHP